MSGKHAGAGFGAALAVVLAVLPLLYGQSPDWSGTWLGKTAVSGDEDALTLVLKKVKSSYSGTIQDGQGIIPAGTEIKDVKVHSPNRLTFVFSTGSGVSIEAALTVQGESMKGEWADPVNGEKGPIELARRP